MKRMELERLGKLKHRADHCPTPFTVQGELHDLADTILKARALQSIALDARRFPIHRQLRYAARRPLEALFDDLALLSGLDAIRLDTAWLILDGPDAFVEIQGKRKSDYSSGTFDIWSKDAETLAAIRERLLEIVGDQLIREASFTIDWHFSTSRMGLESVAFEEIADPALLDEAYPMLGEPVASFIDRYLDSPEIVLVLQGPPGTGKTRLVRAILAAISTKKEDRAEVLYTADRRTLESDEIFVEFITGKHDAFVVEDADYLLTPRVEGNLDLHRFLAVADGVVRALGRKIIFTTNLPNVGDIDDALLRPGRCFAIVRTRALTPSEAKALLANIVACDACVAARISDALGSPGAGSVTLAELFRRVESERGP
jgi:hypothetical protein